MYLLPIATYNRYLDHSGDGLQTDKPIFHLSHNGSASAITYLVSDLVGLGDPFLLFLRMTT